MTPDQRASAKVPTTTICPCKRPSPILITECAKRQFLAATGKSLWGRCSKMCHKYDETRGADIQATEDYLREFELTARFHGNCKDHIEGL